MYLKLRFCKNYQQNFYENCLTKIPGKIVIQIMKTYIIKVVRSDLRNYF